MFRIASRQLLGFSSKGPSRRWIVSSSQRLAPSSDDLPSFDPDAGSSPKNITPSSYTDDADDDIHNQYLVSAFRKFPDGKRFWKPVANTNRKQRPIFVAATKQHVGKTTTSLALMSGLQKRYDKVGFLKPVGQQHVTVRSQNQNRDLQVDKDCVLVHEHFKLHHIDYEDMSPVIIPKGYTKKFVDGEISLTTQIKDVERAMENVTAASDVVLCEGTGHCAVGSIVGMNNARVASLIGADMVLVANGGLGSAFDELELNRILCQHVRKRLSRQELYLDLWLFSS